MPNVLKHCCKLFADNAKLYVAVLLEADIDIDIILWSGQALGNYHPTK